MAKATWKMPEDFLMKVSRLADKTDEPIPVKPKEEVDRVPYLLRRIGVIREEAARGAVPCVIPGVAVTTEMRILCDGHTFEITSVEG